MAARPETARVTASRRWAADPLLLLAGTAVLLALAVGGAVLGRAVPPFTLVLLGVVAAGLSLSGST